MVYVLAVSKNIVCFPGCFIFFSFPCHSQVASLTQDINCSGTFKQKHLDRQQTGQIPSPEPAF